MRRPTKTIFVTWRNGADAETPGIWLAFEFSRGGNIAPGTGSG